MKIYETMKAVTKVLEHQASFLQQSLSISALWDVSDYIATLADGYSRRPEKVSEELCSFADYAEKVEKLERLVSQLYEINAQWFDTRLQADNAYFWACEHLYSALLWALDGVE